MYTPDIFKVIKYCLNYERCFCFIWAGKVEVMKVVFLSKYSVVFQCCVSYCCYLVLFFFSSSFCMGDFSLSKQSIKSVY